MNWSQWHQKHRPKQCFQTFLETKELVIKGECPSNFSIFKQLGQLELIDYKNNNLKLNTSSNLLLDIAWAKTKTLKIISPNKLSLIISHSDIDNLHIKSRDLVFKKSYSNINTFHIDSEFIHQLSIHIPTLKQLNIKANHIDSLFLGYKFEQNDCFRQVNIDTVIINKLYLNYNKRIELNLYNSVVKEDLRVHKELLIPSDYQNTLQQFKDFKKLDHVEVKESSILENL